MKTTKRQIPTNSDRTQKRRKALRALALGGAIGTTAQAIPGSWSKPLINSVLLPAHAETTDDSGSSSGGTDGGSGGLGGGTDGGSGTGGSGGLGGGTTTTTTTTTRRPRPPIGGVLVCEANGRNCEFRAPVVCGSTVDLGTIFANDAVRVILTGFDANASIIIDTSSGNHSCNSCPTETNNQGIAILLFSTGNAGGHLTTVTVGTCVMTVIWDAVHP